MSNKSNSSNRKVMRYTSAIICLMCFGFGSYFAMQNDMICIIWIGAAIINYINYKDGI